MEKEINISRIKRPEWVFQFDNEEPVVFAFYNGDEENEEPKELTIRLSGDIEGNDLLFKSPSGKVFKIFARESEKQKTD